MILNKYRCDRCGKDFHPYDDKNYKEFKSMIQHLIEDMHDKKTILRMRGISSSYIGKNDIEDLDLCEDCLKSFVTWFDEYHVLKRRANIL